MTEWYSIVYMYHIFFIHSSSDGYLGFFFLMCLAIVNSAACIFLNYTFVRAYAQE